MLTRNRWKSMLGAAFSFVRQSMLFAKDTPFLLRAAATALLAVATLMVLVPCVVLFFAVSPQPPHSLRVFQLPVMWWAAWALVALWAGLDSSRLWRTLGRPVDPLGNHALWGMLLGALNIGAVLLVVVLRTSH